MMEDIPEFQLPEFMQEKSTNELHNTMINLLPDDIDKAEGDIAWDFTRPTAAIVAETVGFTLTEAIKQIFPMWAYGAMLDYHATTRGMVRKPATAAVATIHFEGVEGTAIPAGFKVATENDFNASSIEFVITKTGTIDHTGTLELPARAVVAGKIGNVVAHTIVLQSQPLKGIKLVDNLLPATGGTETEDDEALRARLLEYDRSEDISYVGSIADYRRWATSQPGVGNAVIIPAQDDTGLVTIVLTDSNGEPANELLCEQVYNYIMRPDAPEERIAPVNALLSVVPPQRVAVTISAVVELTDGDLEAAKQAYMKHLTAYLSNAGAEREVKYSQIYALLAKTVGIHDFKAVLLNGGTDNIRISELEIPTVSAERIQFTADEV